jgi:hypothetical protein
VQGVLCWYMMDVQLKMRTRRDMIRGGLHAAGTRVLRDKVFIAKLVPRSRDP